MIDNPHPPFCMAQAEDQHIKDGGEVEDSEDSEGCNEGGLGKGQRIGWLTKLAGEGIFNTETTPVDVENIPQKGTGFVWYEDNIIHQTLHCHVQAVGLDQDLNGWTQVINLKFFVKQPWLE